MLTQSLLKGYNDTTFISTCRLQSRHINQYMKITVLPHSSIHKVTMLTHSLVHEGYSDTTFSGTCMLQCLSHIHIRNKMEVTIRTHSPLHRDEVMLSQFTSI